MSFCACMYLCACIYMFVRECVRAFDLSLYELLSVWFKFLRVSVRACGCVRIYVCMCDYILPYLHFSVCVCVCACMSVSACVCLCVRVCACVRACVSVFVMIIVILLICLFSSSSYSLCANKCGHKSMTVAQSTLSTDLLSLLSPPCPFYDISFDVRGVIMRAHKAIGMPVYHCIN